MDGPIPDPSTLDVADDDVVGSPYSISVNLLTHNHSP